MSQIKIYPSKFKITKVSEKVHSLNGFHISYVSESWRTVLGFPFPF